MKISKDMIIGQILEMDPNMAGILMAGGMHCIGCRQHRARAWKKLHGYTALIRICW